jgi:Cu+-exporting ATPase
VIDTVVFDKTGTLTKGEPQVTDIICYDIAEDEVLTLAASVENSSEHPLAKTIVEAARKNNLALKNISDFQSLPGKGVAAKIGDERILIGNLSLMQDNRVNVFKVDSVSKKFQQEGKTAIFIAVDNKLAAIIAAADTLKEFSSQAVSKLKALGRKVIMISGDNHIAASAIAQKAGIEKVLAEIFPRGKADEIKKLQSQGQKVAMVGDGINDAPALTQADIGIAIGSGTDIAIEAGDIVLIKNDLRDVIMAIEFSCYAMRKIKQNLFWAFFYNLASIPIAAGVLYPLGGFLINPMVAGAAMAFSSVSVVANSLSMKRYRKPF